MARSMNLADLFEVVAEEVPGRLAIASGDQHRTFGELDRHGNQLGRHLIANGVGRDDKVAIYAWNRVEWVEALFAAYKVRAAAININYRYVAAELQHVMADSDAKAVFVERAFLPTLAAIREHLPLLQVVVVLDDGTPGGNEAWPEAVDYDTVLAAQSDAPLGIDRDGGDLYMLYTGGTTGMPKGVMWRHEDLISAALMGLVFTGSVVTDPDQLRDRIVPEDTRPITMTIAPIMHGAAQWGMYIGLFTGATAVLYGAHGFDPVEVWKGIATERCNRVMVVGDAIARPLVEALDEPGFDLDVSSLQGIGSGGALFSDVVKDEYRTRFPGIMISDSIGSSEMGASGSPAGPGQHFKLTANMAVLDDDMRPVTPGSGEVGRLARKGAIPLGYYKDQAKTDSTFVPDPDGVRWVIPGDFATVEADGTVILLGRGSACINTGGEKVFPDEVEAALKRHPAVDDVLVVGIPDARFGQRVAAVVQAREGMTPTIEELSAFAREWVAGYKVPRDLRLVPVIGRTASGKADYAWAKQVFVDA
ncbi:MAG: AMP-dependent synthetase and ligase [Ilumatobacteraceae bacterium]|nr:AMP-dependent synthetase and ligase [Ilumatobacteraceae bacterium]